MTKTQKKAEPMLADLLAASQAESHALAELEAKQAAEREAAASAAKAAQDAAEAALNAALAPFRAERDAIIESQVAAIASLAEVKAPIVSKFEAAAAKAKAKFDTELATAVGPYEAAITEAEERIAQLEARVVEETGIPAVLLNADIAPAPKAKAPKSGGTTKAAGRKSPKVADLGILAAVTVTAPKRYPTLDPTNPVTVQYETREMDGAVHLLAKRVDHVVNGVHVLNQAAVEGEYTHYSTVASEVTTTPGWHSTKDVMYALAQVAGILGNFPELAPESEASDIRVNGEPLATPTAIAVTSKETV